MNLELDVQASGDPSQSRTTTAPYPHSIEEMQIQSQLRAEQFSYTMPSSQTSGITRSLAVLPTHNSSQSHVPLPSFAAEISKPAQLSAPPELSRDQDQDVESEILPVYRKLHPSDTRDLVNTIQTIFEEDETVRENGVLLLDAPHVLPESGEIVLPSPEYNFEATSQRVHTPAKLRGTGLLVIKHDVAKLSVKVPKFEPVKNLTRDEMEAVFRKHIDEQDTHNRHPYFNIDINDFKVRPEGSFELTCGSPMDKLSYIAGMNTPYAYYSKRVSHFGAHIEDWYCASYNVLFAGATKLWIAVKPSSQQLFESKIRELFPEAGACVQFIRHLAISISPRTLREWGVEHFFVPQNPGQIVAVTGYTYHWGINTGQNYAEAINFCMEKDWKAAEDFRNCYPGCGLDHAILPLPKPVYEDGTMQEKKESACARDEIARAQWNRDVEAFEEKEEQILSAHKKISKKLRTPTARRQSEAEPPRQSLEVHGESIFVKPQNKPRGASPLESIEVSGPKLPSQRETVRRSTTQRATYRDPGSSAGTTDDENADDEPPVRRPRLKGFHSRHNSGHHSLVPQQQPDIAALVSEIKLIKGFLMEQKKSCAQNEADMRMQLAYHKRQADEAVRQSEMHMRELAFQRIQADEAVKQTAVQEKQLQVQERLLAVLGDLNFRDMRKAQAVETRSIHSGSQAPSNAPSEMSAPSAASDRVIHHSTQHVSRQVSTAISQAGHRHLVGPATSRAAIHAQYPDRTDDALDGPISSKTRSVPLSSGNSIFNAQVETTKTSSHSAQSSRRPSQIELLESAPNAREGASLAYSSLFAGTKSLTATCEIGKRTIGSAPLSLSEACSGSSTGREAGSTTQTSTPLETEDESPSSRTSEDPDFEPEHPTLTLTYDKIAPQSKSSITGEEAISLSQQKRLKCTRCAQRKIQCDRLDPQCSNCADLQIDNECIYLPRKKAARVSPMPARKRKANEVDNNGTASAKKANTTQMTSLAATPSKTTTSLAREVGGGESPRAEQPRALRELLGLATTSEGKLFDGPSGPRRREPHM